MPYSIVKTDDSYVIRVGDQDCLKVNSRRKAAKLISDVQQNSGTFGAEEIVEDGVIAADQTDASHVDRSHVDRSKGDAGGVRLKSR